MIQLRTILKPADNSGAKRLRVIHVHGGSKRRFGRIGDIVTCAVDQVDARGQLKDSQLVKAVIVRTKKEFKRKDGSYIKFDDNAAVVIENIKSKNPIGTRVFGPIAREIKDAGLNAIVSMAPEVI